MKKPEEFRAEILGSAVELMGLSGGTRRLPVVGHSMRPTLLEGQAVAVAPVTSPRRGDLLVFKGADSLVVHRLLGRAHLPDGGPAWRTRGDGRIELDPALDPEKVVGRAVALEHAGAWWDLRRPASRFYAWALAWHALAWSALGATARTVDRFLGRLGLPGPFKRMAASIDAALLGAAQRSLFRAFHRRLDPAPLDEPPSAATRSPR